MRFSKVFSVLSLTTAAMAMPNPVPNTLSTPPTCKANVGGQLACCATTQQVSKDQRGVQSKLLSALGSADGLLSGLLDDLLVKLPVNINAGIECSVTLATVTDCKQQATCCNFGNQVVAGHQDSFISLLSNNNIAVCGVQAV